MIERLLLDRIDTESAGSAVRVELDLTRFDAAYEAQATLPFVHFASTRTHIALNAAVGEQVPVSCRVRHRRFEVLAVRQRRRRFSDSARESLRHFVT